MRLPGVSRPPALSRLDLSSGRRAIVSAHASISTGTSPDTPGAATVAQGWDGHVIFPVPSSVLRHDESVPASPDHRRRPAAGAGRRQVSARVRRRRAVVVTVAVVVVAVVAWFAILPHGGTG